jgi:hypothetical protein
LKLAPRASTKLPAPLKDAEQGTLHGDFRSQRGAPFIGCAAGSQIKKGAAGGTLFGCSA